ncbi:hypothetical protein [Longimicrobium terrae]|uniref:Uncharacterized protein n=1 Tax=Longimicrobium terrae TaxID=1639882 RepID=A0A841H2B5_9BACT|nr:hypothetical protein [Longimicrobium terrae]MBB4637984.1 hypothetical protein [Longimicrobium terrae]MBB6072231.1 hypothetical protein [Longimicrobium terrae]NNC28348.1 hypothetical protein [Longimicrobium terrae]
MAEFQVSGGKEITMELSPRVTHGALRLQGQLQGQSIVGIWSTESFPQAKGGFTVTRQ